LAIGILFGYVIRPSNHSEQSAIRQPAIQVNAGEVAAAASRRLLILAAGIQREEVARPGAMQI
jgi:hypothetical protein